VHQCRHAGDLLIRSEGSTFKKLLSLDFHKLYEFRHLDGSVASFLEKYDVEKMTREEVRSAVKAETGKSGEEEKSPAAKATNIFRLFHFAREVAGMGLPELDEAVKAAEPAQAAELAKAGKALTAVVIERWMRSGATENELENMEKFLAAELREVKNMKSKMLAERYRLAGASGGA